MHVNEQDPQVEPKRARGCRASTVLMVMLILVMGGLVALGSGESGADFWWPEFSLRSNGMHVGLIAGHWQSDSGAVCGDGLQEMEVNLAVAQETARQLRAKGYRVEVLAEFDEALDGYVADALVSIHSDSCESDLSGFKVARSADSYIPETEDRLVAALEAAYQRETRLLPHPNTITDDMRYYHAFRTIAPETPAAIIEIGFLGGDRELLTKHQHQVAIGLAEGIDSFLQGQDE